MESSYNNTNIYGEQHQQLGGSAQESKLNELANDDHVQPTTTEKEQKQLKPTENLSKEKCEHHGNDDLENIHLESLSHEDMTKLVRKLFDEKKQAHKQLEAVKKETEESAKQQAKEMTTKMEEINKALLASEQKVERLTTEMTNLNMKYQKHLDSARQAEEFSQRSVQLEQEKAVQEDLHQKMGEIEKMPKEVEEKSEELAEKAKQIDALLIELNESSHQHQIGLPTEQQQQMKIYFDQSVLDFMRKFQQNGLLDNVCLCICQLSKDIVLPVLCHILPLINGIVAIDLKKSAQMADIYDAGNTKEIHELNMKLMEKTQFLSVSYDYDPEILRANKIDLYCRWLYQTARADGKPRVLVLYYRMNVDYSPISLFIDRLKQDFLIATNPVTFFIRIILPKAFQSQVDICLDNDKSNEKLLTKIEDAGQKNWVFLLISRYPRASTKKWIVENEKEVLNLSFVEYKTIYLTKDLKFVAT